MAHIPPVHRIEWIDFVKGFSLLGIISCHCGILNNYGSILTSGYIQAFFIVSCLTYKNGMKMSDFLKKRAIRLLLPYFIYGFFIWGIFSIINLISRRYSDIIEGLFILFYSRAGLFLENNVQSGFSSFNPFPQWFFTSMFVSSILFVWFCSLKSNIHRIIFIFSSIIATIVLNKMHCLFPWSLDTSFYFFLIMIFSISFKDLIFKITQNKVLVLIFFEIHLLVCILLMEHINLSIRLYGNHGDLSILSSFIKGFTYLFFSIAIFFFTKPLGFIRRYICFIGQNTVTFMFIHMPFVFISNIFTKNYITFVLTVIFCSIIAYILNQYRDRITLFRYL